MTNEQILKLAELSGLNSFTGEKDDGTDSEYWEGWEDQLLKFALAVHEEGYNKGYYRASYDAELGFVDWFNDLFSPYTLRSEWFEGDCETKDLNQRKEILRRWVHAAFVAGYELGKGGQK
jgi:hypothetical protein